ncbi:hypothetical protein [Methylobacterium sp. E-045]|uniref:hypothetical protein n=1 Tax=Methylobacterium sp. E-045 TaxID=2836575 RepID=UPI001FBAB1C7|nr:hypothetical protein [Methylobacterium sp. E-045]MCJ2131459.1 hypothetical protein [Methylobacterium sp. E-045]
MRAADAAQRKEAAVLRTIALAMCFGLLAVPAQSQENRLKVLGDRAAALNSMDIFCGNFYLVDKLEAQKWAQRVAKEAVDRFGLDSYSKALNDGSKTAIEQIKANGAAIWCPMQRENLKKAGIRGVIGGNLP